MASPAVRLARLSFLAALAGAAIAPTHPLIRQSPPPPSAPV